MSILVKNCAGLLRRLWTEMVVWGSFALFVVIEIEVMYVVYKVLRVW